MLKFYEIWFYYYGEDSPKNQNGKQYAFYLRTKKDIKDKETLINELKERFTGNKRFKIRSINYIPEEDFNYLSNWFEISEDDFNKHCGHLLL